MKCAISLDSNIEVEKLVKIVNSIVQDQLKREGSLEDSLLVISVAKAVDGEFVTSP